MSKFFAFYLFVLISFLCSAQKQNTMRTFDIKTFKKEITGTEYKFINKDSTVITQKERQFEYKETIQPQKSFFETINKYYKSGQLKSTVLFFPNNFLKGIKKEYNEQGVLIKETDYDAPYKFTWEAILKLIKERDIDMNGNNFEVGRNIVENRPVWSIIFNKTDSDRLGVIGIDGNTGEIFQESEIDGPKDGEYETLPDMENE